MSAERSRVFQSDRRIVVVVAGDHGEDEAASCAEHVAGLVAAGCDELVVDLTTIRSYTRGARQVWQARLVALASSFRQLTLVGGTPLARMASTAVCLYAGIKMHSVDRLDELVPQVQVQAL